MTQETDQLKWTQPDWLEDAYRWIHDQLGRLDRQVTGSIEQPHVRPWGTVMRIPTNQGNVYFKTISLLLPNETAVTHALSQWQPGKLPALLTADTHRNWMLVEDGGLRLRDAFNNGLSVNTWSDILADYAAFQIELSTHVKALLSLGSPDRRLAILPSLYEKLVTDQEWLLIDQPDGLSSKDVERLVSGIPHIKQLCGELAGYAIPDSLHHGDLHDGNIFIQDGRILFFDWGDSQITHPFFSLRTAFVSMEYTFDYEENHPSFDGFAQDYLKIWSGFQSQENLWAAYQVAERLWAIPTALQWKLVMSRLDAVRQTSAYTVPSLLQEVLASNPEL
jgi:hypothetical protein